MYIEGRPGYEQVSYAEQMFSQLSDLLDMLPDDGSYRIAFPTE